MEEARPRSQRSSHAERSAGVVLFRQSGDRKVFLLLDYGRYWDFPKGHVEAGENDRAAALRELAEETGIVQAELADGFEEPIVYFFRQPHRGLVRKTVVFYLAGTSQTDVRISHEHVGYEWLDAANALKRLKYATAKRILRKAADALGEPIRDG